MTIKTKRLTKELATEIVTAVLRETFAARLLKLVEQEKSLGDRAYEASIPKEHLDLMRKLPAQYFPCTYYVRMYERTEEGTERVHHPMYHTDSERWRCLYVMILGSGPRYESFSLGMSKSRPFPAHQDLSERGMPFDLFAEVLAWKSAFRELFEEASDLERKIRSVLMSVKTVKALLEIWPECKPHIPKEAFAVENRSLPMTVIADLNEAINKAKGEASAGSMSAAAVNELVKEAA